VTLPPMRRATFLALCLLLSPPALAKGHKHKDAPPPEAPAAQAPAAQAPAAQAPAADAPAASSIMPTQPPVLELVEAGAEPRQVLRVHPAAGSVERVRMTMDMATAMAFGDTQPPRMVLPSMLLDMEVSVLDISTKGDVHYSFRIAAVDVADSPGAMPGVRDAMLQSLQAMIGTEGEATVSDNGEARSAHLTPPLGADPKLFADMERSLTNMSAPLPRDEVGQGARWTLTQSLGQEGISVQQLAQYQITELTGDTVTLDVQLSQTAPEQDLAMAAMPPGTRAHLQRLSSTGTGHTVLDLGRVMPTSMAMQLSMIMTMAVSDGTQSMDMSMQMDMSTVMEPTPG